MGHLAADRSELGEQQVKQETEGGRSGMKNDAISALKDTYVQQLLCQNRI